jgi:hypothetical protein
MYRDAFHSMLYSAIMHNDATWSIQDLLGQNLVCSSLRLESITFLILSNINNANNNWGENLFLYFCYGRSFV